MDATVEKVTWSWRRVACLALLLFGIQGVLLYSLTARYAPSKAEAKEVSSYQFAPTGGAVEEAASAIELSDPTVFALPHPRGFSGLAWFGPAVTKHALAEIRATPSFLKSEDALTFGIIAPRIEVTNSSFALEPLPPPPSAALELTRVLPSGSGVRVEGELAARKVTVVGALQAQRSPTTLSNSIVQIAVDEKGFPMSARLLTSSGSVAADAEALAHARGIRFAPAQKLQQPERAAVPMEKIKPSFAARAEDLTWGELVYRWLTLDPNATNRPAGK